MKFRDLNTTLQEKICYNIHGKEMWELSNIGRDNLDYLTAEEMFDAWLQYEGIIGYTDNILNLHKLLFSEETP